MWLSITFLLGLWMTTGTLSERKAGYYSFEIDSCLNRIKNCSEFKIPLSLAKIHMFKLYTKAKDLKKICKREERFIRCMKGAKEICHSQLPLTPREEKLIRSADFAEQLCEDSCTQKAYLENANCINSLQPDANDCFSMGMKYAEEKESSVGGLCRLLKSFKDCLIQIARKKCGTIAADIQKKISSFEMGIYSSCPNFEERYKTKTSPSCDASSYGSEELAKLNAFLKYIILLSESTESLLNSDSPAVVLQRPKEKSTEKGSFSKRVDASDSNSEHTPEPEFSTITEISSDADSPPTEVDARAVVPEYSTKYNELSIINVAKRYIKDIIFITDLLFSSVLSSNVNDKETFLESEYSTANEALSNTEESFSDKHLGVNWSANIEDTDIEDTTSVIASMTSTAAEESSCEKMPSDSSLSEPYNEVCSEEHKNTAEMCKRTGDEVFHVSPKIIYTHTNISTFALYAAWTKKQVYMGCGIASISWVKDMPMQRVYCSFTDVESDLDNPFKCAVEVDIVCFIKDKSNGNRSKLSTSIEEMATLGLKLVVYRKPKNENNFRVRASMEISHFLPNPAYHLGNEKCNVTRQKEEAENLPGNFLPIVVERVENRRKRSDTSNEGHISQRSGSMLKLCTDLEKKQHHGNLPQCSLIDYVLIGGPYYPHRKDERNNGREDTICHVRASVKIRDSIKIDPDANF